MREYVNAKARERQVGAQATTPSDTTTRTPVNARPLISTAAVVYRPITRNIPTVRCAHGARGEDDEEEGEKIHARKRQRREMAPLGIEWSPFERGFDDKTWNDT